MTFKSVAVLSRRVASLEECVLSLSDQMTALAETVKILAHHRKEELDLHTRKALEEEARDRAADAAWYNPD